MFQGKKEKKVKCQLFRLPQGENKTQKLLSEDEFCSFCIPYPNLSLDIAGLGASSSSKGWRRKLGSPAGASLGDVQHPGADSLGLGR